MKLAKINNLLLASIIFVNGYVIIAPFVPSLLFKWESHTNKKQQLQAALRPAKPSTSGSSSSQQPNHVVIPSMLLDQPILDGPMRSRYAILNTGIWRWPLASTPDKGGNTVLIGHRFTYTNPRGVFYFLNKIAIGNEIGMFWGNHKYLYKVVTINVVSPTDTNIENNTPSPELTLFTCTPLWLPKDRLVVVANLESKT